MKTTNLRSLAVVAFAGLSFVSSLAAQQSPSLLSSVEVRRLIASADPGDNARLADHFTALADRYTADARRHTAMAASYASNPRRTISGMSEHCKRPGDLDTQSASALRELATYHRGRATGAAPAAPPAGTERFQAGAGSPAPSEAEISTLAAKASTRADHLALEEYFLGEAKRYTAEAADHVAMAGAYRGSRIAQAAVHCDRLAKLASDEAKEATAAAAMHRSMAQ